MNRAKILIIDIETAPILAYTWKLFKPMLSIDNIVHDWYMLCWAAKWLNDEHTMYEALWLHKRAYNRNKKDDRSIVSSIWYLLDEADIVVAHNARRFDVAKLNAKFYEYGFEPPSPYKIVDTLLTVRGKFKLTSNKLDYVSQLRSFGSKLDTTFQLWLDVIDGKPTQCANMIEYNIHDVELLEDVYVDLLPWTSNHPNVSLYDADQSKPLCPRCGSNHMKKDGTVSLIAGIYQQYKCKDCGGWARGGTNLRPKSGTSTTLRNVP